MLFRVFEVVIVLFFLYLIANLVRYLFYKTSQGSGLWALSNKMLEDDKKKGGLAAQQVEINRNKALAEEEEAKRKEAQARGEKLKTIQEAEGRAASVKIEADAQRYKLEQEATGNLAIYQAEAEGKRLLTQAVGGGQYVVGLKFAERLAPGVQTITVPISENGNYLMDISGIMKQALNK